MAWSGLGKFIGQFRRLLLRFERISGVHYAFKTLAYSLSGVIHSIHAMRCLECTK